MAHLRACLVLSLLVGLVVLGAWASPGAALEEADRLFLVGEKAFDDGLYPLSRRMLERFVERFPSERRAGEATLLLGKARLSQGAGEAALEAFKKAESFQPPPGKPGELRFWEAEAFYRLKRFSDARTAYSDVIAGGAAGPRVADALYGLGWSELEAKRREPAAAAFQRLVSEFPDHALAPTATIQLARTFIELKRDAETARARLRKEFPEHPLTGRTSLQSAQAAFTKNAFREAATLARAAAKSPEDAVRGEAFLLVGESEMKLKRPAQALPAFQAAGDTAGLEPALHFRALAAAGAPAPACADRGRPDAAPPRARAPAALPRVQSARDGLRGRLRAGRVRAGALPAKRIR